MLKEKEEEIKRLNATEKIRNDAEDEAQSLTQELMASVLAGAARRKCARRQAESAESGDCVATRGVFQERGGFGGPAGTVEPRRGEGFANERGESEAL